MDGIDEVDDDDNDNDNDDDDDDEDDDDDDDDEDDGLPSSKRQRLDESDQEQSGSAHSLRTSVAPPSRIGEREHRHLLKLMIAYLSEYPPNGPGYKTHMFDVITEQYNEYLGQFGILPLTSKQVKDAFNNKKKSYSAACKIMEIIGVKYNPDTKRIAATPAEIDKALDKVSKLEKKITAHDIHLAKKQLPYFDLYEHIELLDPSSRRSSSKKLSDISAFNNGEISNSGSGHGQSQSQNQSQNQNHSHGRSNNNNRLVGGIMIHHDPATNTTTRELLAPPFPAVIEHAIGPVPPPSLPESSDRGLHAMSHEDEDYLRIMGTSSSHNETRHQTPRLSQSPSLPLSSQQQHHHHHQQLPPLRKNTSRHRDAYRFRRLCQQYMTQEEFFAYLVCISCPDFDQDSLLNQILQEDWDQDAKQFIDPANFLVRMFLELKGKEGVTGAASLCQRLRISKAFGK